MIAGTTAIILFYYFNRQKAWRPLKTGKQAKKIIIITLISYAELAGWFEPGITTELLYNKWTPK